MQIGQRKVPSISTLLTLMQAIVWCNQLVVLLAGLLLELPGVSSRQPGQSQAAQQLIQRRLRLGQAGGTTGGSFGKAARGGGVAEDFSAGLHSRSCSQPAPEQPPASGAQVVTERPLTLPKAQSQHASAR